MTTILQAWADSLPSNNQAQKEDSLFHFDPNLLSEKGFERLGLPPWTIQTILNYRSKGGQFRKRTDFQKIYNLPDSTFQKLYSFLLLPEKEGIELLFNVVYNINSANLLAKFIASQLKKVKRHKFLLSFLKQTLTILLNSSLAKIKGVKIIVKGRINGVPRAKHKIIIVGDVPVQTISAKLDYSQATAHNSNGSYGIKVWVVEK